MQQWNVSKTWQDWHVVDDVVSSYFRNKWCKWTETEYEHKLHCSKLHWIVPVWMKNPAWIVVSNLLVPLMTPHIFSTNEQNWASRPCILVLIMSKVRYHASTLSQFLFVLRIDGGSVGHAIISTALKRAQWDCWGCSQVTYRYCWI